MKSTFYTIRGIQNELEFYQTTLTYGEIDVLARITGDAVVDEILLDELISNIKISNKGVQKIGNYLQTDNSFCSVLTFFVVPRRISKLEKGVDYTVDTWEGDFTKLTIKTSFFLLAVDGRHRIVAIKDILTQNFHLSDEQVPVVLIPFNSPSESRKLFSDLMQSKGT